MEHAEKQRGGVAAAKGTYTFAIDGLDARGHKTVLPGDSKHI